MPNAKLTKSQRRRRNRAERSRMVSQSHPQQSAMVQIPVPNASSTVRSRASRRKGRRARNAQQSVRNNPYLATLLDPDGVVGVKIPDVTTFPSSTVKLSMDGFLACGSGGDSVSLFVRPILGDGASYYPVITGYGSLPGSTSATSNSSWGSRAAIAGVYQALRPVSATISCEFVGNSNTDSGTIIGALLPPGIGVPTNLNAAMTMPNSMSGPVRNGMRVIWKPCDNSNFEYWTLNAQANLVNILPTMCIYVTGLSAGTASVIKYRVVVNFEGLVFTDTQDFVDVQPSPVDVLGFTQALNSASRVASASFLFGQYATPYMAPLAAAALENGLRRLRM